ncbi:MAG: glycerol kinase [Gammaproteobacteria bacterium]|jgi:glycerol kinase|nr:glycerol kinase [Gammaproteobacteria bacterium]
MAEYLLAIDQGTTSTRAIVFDDKGNAVGQSQKALPNYFPKDGWVEHDPETIWRDVVSVCRDALFHCNLEAGQIKGIGITNQRETSIVWERKTGKAIYPAIVWQDRRCAEFCQNLKSQGLEQSVQAKTGLLLDSYFSATKVRWILENVKGAREQAEKGELAFGTIDCFLLWRLTGGKVHATDATNASRTLLFNIHTQAWDKELLKIFDIPESMLPTVKNCSDNFGLSQKDLLGSEVPITGIAGDQQAATIGQACFKPGMIKSTYGTGAFIVLNTGEKAIQSTQRLLTTVAYRFNNKPTYALEGSIFVAGAVMQWLRDNIHMFKESKDSQALAESVPDTHGVYFIPAFTGLGAPYWEPNVRGAIMGLTRESNIAHITRAALESVCYQTKDLLSAMLEEGGVESAKLRVDGGMVANDWLCQFLADMLDIEVERPKIIETTALGAAYLAGLQVGIFKDLDDITKLWQKDKDFQSDMDSEKRNRLYQGWHKAVSCLLNPVP